MHLCIRWSPTLSSFFFDVSFSVTLLVSLHACFLLSSHHVSQAAVLRLLFVATRSADHFSPSENLSALSSPTAMDALAAASLWPPEIESLALPAPTPSAATLPLSFQQDNHDIKAASVSPWALLRGHEATILPLIGEFSGLLCGRALRHARECEIFL